MLYSEYSRVVVKEFKSVALLDEVSVSVISKGNAVLGSSSASCVIGKGVAVIRFQLTVILPNSILAMVCCRIADKKRAAEAARKSYGFFNSS